MSVMATERELERAFYAKMVNELTAIRNSLEVDNFIIDEWGVGINDTVIPVKRVYDGPIIVSSILAVYPPLSTSAVINLGQPGRNIALPTQIASPSFGTNQELAFGNAAAAGNGSAVSPAFSIVTGFTLGFGNVTTANNLAVTVTGAQGGTLTYSIALAVGQNNPFSVTFPGGLQPTGTQITVTVTGNANSPAVSIALFGQPFVSSVAPAANAGFFNATDLKIELQQDDNLRNLTIAPAGPAYINFIGYADRKQIDRQIR